MPSKAALTGDIDTGRLHGLDALRGIAAMAVVIMHAHVLFPQFPDLFPRGYLAVDFFFVLSGYVMARTYEPRLAAGMRPMAFFTARYRRLWPTMALGGILFLAFLPEGTRGEDIPLLGVAMVNLLLLPNPWSRNSFALNVPAWSIFFELVANLAHGVFWRISNCGLVALIVLAGALLGYLARDHGHLDIGSRSGDVLEGLSRVATAYAMGVLVWRSWGQRRIDPLLGILALIVMPLWFAIPERIDGTNWLWDVAFVYVLCVPLLLGGLALQGARRLSTIAGELSFPLYALHYPLLYWIRAWGLSAGVAIVGCVLCAGIFAWAQLAWRNRHSQDKNVI
ncbi:MAG: acyltransferase family protein [Novosphingobium sp.]